jgi:tetratricopeptide (TPR) repeat protein
MGRLGEASVEFLQALAIADSNVVPEKQRDDLLQFYEPIIEDLRQEEDSQAHERICDNVTELLMRTGWRENLIRARQQLPDQVDAGPPLPLAEVIIQARSGQVVDLLTNIYQLANDGYLDSAMEEAYFALHYASTYLPLHAYMGELLIKKGDLQDAINKLIIVAQTYNSRGEPQRAIDLYRRVIVLAPMDLNPRSRLINLLIGMDKIDEALAEYLDFAEVYYSLADLEMSRKTYSDALRLAEQSPVDRSWQVRILKRIADIDLQSLDWRRALEVYERIRSFQPDDKGARASLIELNFRLGQESQGLAELDQYIAYLKESGENDQAILFVENLLQEDPDRAQLHVRLAELYRRADRMGEAIQQLDAAGDSLLDAGDRDGAVQVLERILTLNPPNINEYQQLLAQLRRQ